VKEAADRGGLTLLSGGVSNGISQVQTLNDASARLAHGGEEKT
jgi:hypothetical protein